ncbi:hypothetical protein ACA910_013637 [Epithemia clementina (nom. ined.)]
MDSKSANDASNHEAVGVAATQAAPACDGTSDDDDSDDANLADDIKGDPAEQTNRLRREKRLAMNRESARARRKRKKILIETLEHQVAELTKSNQNYRHQVSELEKELIVAKQTIQMLSRQGTPMAQQPSMMFNHALPQTSNMFGGRRADSNQNETVLRFLEARNQPVMGNVAVSGSSGHSTPCSPEQLFRLEGIGLQSLSQQNVGPRLSGMASPGAGIDRRSSQLGDLGYRLSVTGSQTTNSLHRSLIGTSTVDEALAREQLLMLQQQRQRQQQQSQQTSSMFDRAALSGDTATRAILLRQLLQEQEMSAAQRKASDRGS